MKKLTIRAAATVVALAPAVALAQETIPSPISDPSDFVTLLGTVASWMFTIFLALAVILILYSIFSGKTRQVLLYAVVAIILAVLAGSIIPLIGGIIGV